MKIKSIETSGELTDTRITPWGYQSTRMAYRLGTPSIILPTWEELLGIDSDRDALWIQPGNLVILITLKNGHQYRFELKRGFIWDKASKPGDREPVESEIPVRIHDACCSNKYFGDTNRGFRKANWLFFKALRYYGMPWVRAVTWLFFVNGITGRALYAKNNRAWWHGQTVDFSEGRGLEL